MQNLPPATDTRWAFGSMNVLTASHGQAGQAPWTELAVALMHLLSQLAVQNQDCQTTAKLITLTLHLSGFAFGRGFIFTFLAISWGKWAILWGWCAFQFLDCSVTHWPPKLSFIKERSADLKVKEYYTQFFHFSRFFFPYFFFLFNRA